MASWFQLKNLKQAVPPSARAIRAQCPSALTEVISSSGEYHSDRRGKLEMSSTPFSPIDIRASGQLVATTPNAVGMDRRTPMNVCWVATLIDATGREQVKLAADDGKHDNQWIGIRVNERVVPACAECVKELVVLRHDRWVVEAPRNAGQSKICCLRRRREAPPTYARVP